MQRLKDYLSFSVWHAGFSYVALWAMAFWALEHGPRVFEQSGVCRPNHAHVLFYWACDDGSAWTILATLANSALTLVVWAPVYVAAAVAGPDALVIAVPIVLAHLLGLAAAILVTTRLMVKLFALIRRAAGPARRPAVEGVGRPDAERPGPAVPAPRRAIKPRRQFGLRGGSA
jgi:hypothetical protein